MAGPIAVPEEDQEVEEVQTGGLLDPIKERGVLRGGLDLAGMMVPGAWTGSMGA